MTQRTGARIEAHVRLPLLRFPALERAGLAHGVTTRAGGVSTDPYASLNLGLSVGDERARVLENRRRAADRILPGAALATARQVHGIEARLVTRAPVEGEPVANADMLLSATPGLLLMVQSADCVLLLVFDPLQRAVAAAHAGWRGAAAGAGRALVSAMQRELGCAPAGLLVGIAPAIGGCCYEVGEDVAEAVAAASPPGARNPVLPRPGERPHLDLALALRDQLEGAGVLPDHIEEAQFCTACRTDLFYSHRAEGEPTGRFGAFIGIPA